MDKTPLGRMLQAAREAKGWSIAELARNVGRDRAMLSRIESGRGRRRLTGSHETLCALAKALDLDHGDVLRAAAASRSGSSPSCSAA